MFQSTIPSLVGSSFIKLPNEIIQEKVWSIFKISMIMNAWNGVWLDPYILQIIIKYFNILIYDYTVHQEENIFVVIVYKLLEQQITVMSY